MITHYYHQLSQITVTLYNETAYQRNINLLLPLYDNELPKPLIISIGPADKGNEISMFDYLDYTKPTQKGTKIPIISYNIANLSAKKGKGNPFKRDQWVLIDEQHGWHQSDNHHWIPITNCAHCVPISSIKDIQIKLVKFVPCNGPILHVNFCIPHETYNQIYLSKQFQIEHSVLLADLWHPSSVNNEFITIETSTYQESTLKHKQYDTVLSSNSSSTQKLNKIQWQLIKEKYLNNVIKKNNFIITKNSMANANIDYDNQIMDRAADIYINLSIDTHNKD